MTRDNALNEAFLARRLRGNDEDGKTSFLASLAASGYAVVPIVSTLEMRWQGREQAIENSHGTNFPSTDNIQSIWRAMVSAATGENDGQ